MATREEVRAALKQRLGKYKVQTPTRIAYLGDGRGQATSNIVPPGEPDKFWARESLNGDKPFKVLNRNPNFTPAFNLPILLGYPEDDPDTEQVMGIHRGLVQFSTGNAGSAIGGVAPHHIKHEWGGGDEVFVDPRMFKPGLVKPTAPASMYVKVLSFEHYYNYWRRYDGGTSPDLTQYKPGADYRYVLLTLDPDTNQLCVRPGAIFIPDLSIDSIISNQAQNTFRHIPVPPGNEIPLGVVLLEPGTTKIDWNINGVNNLLPMRILLSSPMKEVNERLSMLESATGVSSLPSTGAGNSIQTDLLPGRIDGNITRLVLNRSSSSSTLPTLFVGELAFVNNSPSQIWVGTASGNHVFNPGGGGGATTLGDLTDVNISVINDQFLLKYDAATSSWIGASAIKIGDNSSGVYFNVGASLVGITAPLRIDNPDAVPLLQTGYGILLDAVGGGYPIKFGTPAGQAAWIGGVNGDENIILVNPDAGGARMVGADDNGVTLFEYAPDSGFRFTTENSSSALDVRYSDKKVLVNNDTGLSPLMLLDTADNHITFGSGLSALRDGVFEIHSPSNIRLNNVGHFNHYSNSLNRATTYEYYFKNQSGSMVSFLQQTYATVTTSYAAFGLTALSAGVLRPSVFVVDTSVGEVAINDLGSTLDFRAESSSHSQKFKVDAKLNAVQIGTSVAGQIADFRDHLIEFNKNKNDIDLIIRGTTADRFVFIDSGNESFGINTASPNASYRLHVVANGTANSLFQRDSSTDAAVNVMYNADTTSGNNAIIGFSTDTTGAGATAQKSGGQIRLYFDQHNDSTFRTHFEFWTRQSGFSNKLTIGAGLVVGSATGGDKGTGTINVSGNIYKNNTAYTNPDYAIEHWAMGKIERFRNNEGAKGYYRLSIDESKEFAKNNLHLPRISRQTAGIFDMADMALEKIEEAHIYIYELHDRIKALEAKIAQLEKK